MARINNLTKYPKDTNITRDDYIIGTDFENNLETKNFSVGDLIDFIATETSDIGQNNRFIEIGAGTLDEGDSVAAAINALPQYEILDTELSIVEDTEIAVDRGGFDTYGRYLKINKGKDIYGVGGAVLLDVDMLRLNPIQPETIRNTLLLNSLYVGNVILKGAIYWLQNLDFGTTGFRYLSDFQIFETPAQEPITLSAADPTLDRIDVFAIDIPTNQVVIIEGTPAASPLEPSLTNYESQIRITSVLVEAAATTPSGVTDQLIYDENVGEPNEWTVTENTSAARINLSSIADSYTGSISAEGTALLASGDWITFTNDVPLSSTSPFSINFRIKNKTTNRFRIAVTLFNSGSAVSQDVIVRRNQFGYTNTDTSSWQTVDIPSNEFVTTGANFDAIRFTFKAEQGSSVDGFYIDNVRLIEGVIPPETNPNTYLGLLDTTDTDYAGKNTFVPAVTNENELTLVNPNTLVDTLYTADGTIGANRVATIGGGFTLQFVGATNGTSVLIDDANKKTTLVNSLDIGGNTIDSASDNVLVVAAETPETAVNSVTNSDASIVIGDTNTMTGSFYSTIIGYGNQMTNGYTNFISGTQNVSDSFYGMIHGRHSDVLGAWYASAIGTGLINRHNSSLVVGQANVDRSVDNSVNSTSKAMFVVGIGTLITAGGLNDRDVAADGFEVIRNGEVNAPSLTNAIIDAETTGQVLLTRNWFEENGGQLVKKFVQQEDSGTADGTTANKLIQSGKTFTLTVRVGDKVVNTTDTTETFVTAVDSNTQLSLADDIMVSGENYQIFSKSYVRRDREEANYGDVGSWALDFSWSSGASSTRGATGDDSVLFGVDNIASGYGAFGNGYLLDLSGTYTTGFGYSVIGAGYTAFGTGSFVKGINDFSFAGGNGVDNDGEATFMYGAALLQSSTNPAVGCAILGAANEEVTGGTYNGTSVDNPVLIVGNGTFNTPVGAEWTAVVRSNALVIKRSGEATLPSTDIADINAAGAKSIATKEYVDQKPESIGFAVSDETSDLTTGTGKFTFRMPYAFVLTEVRASVGTAPTGSTITVDVNEGGVSIFSTLLTIDAGEKTSTTAATPAVISDANLADDAEITIDIDQIGSTVAGAGLKIWFIGYQA